MAQWDRLKVSHYAGAVCIGSFSVSTIQMFVRHWLPLGVNLALSISLFLLLVASMVGLMHHGRHLCPECAVRLPLDCEAQAQKHRRRLSFTHAINDHKRIFFAVVVILAVMNWNTGIIGFGAGLVLNLLGIYVVLSLTEHTKLQPWCPWCKEGGEYQEAPEVQPREPQFA